MNQLPGGVIDDRLMQSFVQFLLVPDFADVDRIPQDVVEGPAREGRTTTDPTKPIGSLFADCLSPQNCTIIFRLSTRPFVLGPSILDL